MELSQTINIPLKRSFIGQIPVNGPVRIIKINNIIVANIDGSNAADLSVAITKSGGDPIKIASTISVPADATLVVIDKNTALYLEEGDNIEAGARAASDLTITINYEELS